MPKVEEGGALDMARFLGLADGLAELSEVKSRKARAVQQRVDLISGAQPGKGQSRRVCEPKLTSWRPLRYPDPAPLPHLTSPLVSNYRSPPSWSNGGHETRLSLLLGSVSIS